MSIPADGATTLAIAASVAASVAVAAGAIALCCRDKTCSPSLAPLPSSLTPTRRMFTLLIDQGAAREIRARVLHSSATAWAQAFSEARADLVKIERARRLLSPEIARDAEATHRAWVRNLSDLAREAERLLPGEGAQTLRDAITLGLSG